MVQRNFSKHFSRCQRNISLRSRSLQSSCISWTSSICGYSITEINKRRRFRSKLSWVLKGLRTVWYIAYSGSILSRHPRGDISEHVLSGVLDRFLSDSVASNWSSLLVEHDRSWLIANVCRAEGTAPTASQCCTVANKTVIQTRPRFCERNLYSWVLREARFSCSMRHCYCSSWSAMTALRGSEGRLKSHGRTRLWSN
jgi:hypothetical protein